MQPMIDQSNRAGKDDIFSNHVPCKSAAGSDFRQKTRNFLERFTSVSCCGVEVPRVEKITYNAKS